MSVSLKAAIIFFDRQLIYQAREMFDPSNQSVASQLSRERELFTSQVVIFTGPLSDNWRLFAAWLVKVGTDTTPKWWSYLSVSVVLLQLELT